MSNELYKYWYWILFLPCFLIGCSFPEPPTYKDYIVLTILSHLNNENQVQLSMEILDSLNRDLQLVDATYTYSYLCNDLDNLGNVVRTRETKSIVPEQLDYKLGEKTPICKAGIKNLDQVIQSIGDQDSNKKIIVFMQIPWSKIDNDLHKSLKKQFSGIKNKKNILKIYGFGGQGDLPKIADIFHGVPVHPFVGIDTNQTGFLPAEAKKIIDADLTSNEKSKKQ
jgi:hypothetical protein